jgi:hypothetical protein
MIDLNQITDKTLNLLIPDLMAEDIQDFFKYKNDPQNPVFFNTLEQFKAYWVNQANVISTENFDEIFNKFEAQGLKFGPSPTIFQIISEGLNGRAEYKLTAYVVMPAQPQPDPVKDTDKDGVPDDKDAEPNNPDIPNVGGNSGPKGGSNAAAPKEQKTQLLEPRIVEIFIN